VYPGVHETGELQRDRGEVRVVIDLTTELTAWLRSVDARTLMKEIVAEAVQTELRSALEDDVLQCGPRSWRTHHAASLPKDNSK